MGKLLARVGTKWVNTRGSGAGAPAPLAPEETPDGTVFDDRGFYLTTPVVATYAAGVFSLVGRVYVDVPRSASLVQMAIAAPNGTRYDGGFRANVNIAEQVQVSALDQKANATGTWRGWLTYSLDNGSTYLAGPSRSFTIASLT